MIVPISINCECGKQFLAKEENVGRRFACPDCGRELVVPKPKSDPFGSPVYEELETKTSGKAIASLVLGILSFFCAFFTGIPAIILGALGLSNISRSKGRVGGQGLAIAGIVTGGIGTVLLSLVSLVLLLPAFQAAREAARRAQCVNNLALIGLAQVNTASATGKFPTATITDAGGKPLLSWRVAILPYLEQNDLYKQFKLDEPWDSPANIKLLAQMPPVYLCQSEGVAADGTTYYQVVVGPGTIFDGTTGTSLDKITDGISNTLLVVEGKNGVPWTKPDDIDLASVVTSIGSKHPGGFNAVFADGSVRFLKNTTSPVTLKAYCTKDAGEAIAIDPM